VFRSVSVLAKKSVRLRVGLVLVDLGQQFGLRAAGSRGGAFGGRDDAVLQVGLVGQHALPTGRSFPARACGFSPQ
jgi:hypothetical protein